MEMGYPSLIEPVPISDDFVQSIQNIEIVGSCARFVLYAEHSVPELGGKIVRVVISKIVMPMDSIPLCVQQATGFMAARTIERIANVVRLR